MFVVFIILHLSQRGIEYILFHAELSKLCWFKVERLVECLRCGGVGSAVNLEKEIYG